MRQMTDMQRHEVLACLTSIRECASQRSVIRMAECALEVMDGLDLDEAGPGSQGSQDLKRLHQRLLCASGDLAALQGAAQGLALMRCTPTDNIDIAGVASQLDEMAIAAQSLRERMVEMLDEPPLDRVADEAPEPPEGEGGE